MGVNMLPKNGQRLEAIKLREQGKSLNEISTILSVAKSSVSTWVRHIPKPERFRKEIIKKERIAREKIIKEVREKNRTPLKIRILSGDGRWMMWAPEGYEGKKYIGNRYVYEHRYIMEQKLGRLLSYNEVVHHLNRNKLDNRPDNLEIKSRSTHTTGHIIPAETGIVVCAYCGKSIIREKRRIRSNKKSGLINSYCSYSHEMKHFWKQGKVNLKRK